MNYSYEFSAVKGKQAQKEYYIAMVPLKYLNRMFSNDWSTLTPEYRAQRKLNTNRIPTIKNYILDNPSSYVFSALSASIDGDYTFESAGNSDLGILKIDINAGLLINDGQHRKAAIIEALKENKKLEKETISIVFFEDLGLNRSQQMFTDLNKHAVKTSNSLSTLYDSRDALSILSRNVIKKNAFFRKYTDLEKDNLGKNSSMLFTLSSIYKANKKIIGRNKMTDEIENFIHQYWFELTKNIVEWNELFNGDLYKKDLREDYVLSLGVIISVFGKLGNWFLSNIDTWNQDKEKLEKFKSIDWTRRNPAWKYRIINEKGKIINSEQSVILATNYLKNRLNIKLNNEEKIKEDKMREMV